MVGTEGLVVGAGDGGRCVATAFVSTERVVLAAISVLFVSACRSTSESGRSNEAGTKWKRENRKGEGPV